MKHPTNTTNITNFPMRVTDSFLKKINLADLHDPLLKQILPTTKELKSPRGYKNDPLDEKSYNPAPGLLHKYHGRALVLITNDCAINCRFCFRRNFLGTQGFNQKHFAKAVAYIKRDPSIKEVILSGGDPLTITDKTIEDILHQLAAIKHLKRVRIHTRMPIANPKQITPNLANILVSTRLQPTIVIHCNHANEIDNDVGVAIDIFRTAKINVFNQSVLLKGINDSVPALVELSEALNSIGVTPYYLHSLDKVAGAAHFWVDLKKAKALHRKMCNLLPGYLVPRLVQETAGKQAKSWI